MPDIFPDIYCLVLSGYCLAKYVDFEFRLGESVEVVIGLVRS